MTKAPMSTTDQIFSTMVITYERMPKIRIVMTIEQIFRFMNDTFMIEGTNLKTGRYCSYMGVTLRAMQTGTYSIKSN